MAIECNEISQVANELLQAFQDCNKIQNSDLRKMVELIIAVGTCASGGPLYNTTVTDVYQEETDRFISYPQGSFHSVTLMIVNGTIDYYGITLPQGSTINIEFTTLNDRPFEFEANGGSKVIVEYLIETVDG